jgi:hypothetical protein
VRKAPNSIRPAARFTIHENAGNGKPFPAEESKRVSGLRLRRSCALDGVNLDLKAKNTVSPTLGAAVYMFIPTQGDSFTPEIAPQQE